MSQFQNCYVNNILLIAMKIESTGLIILTYQGQMSQSYMSLNWTIIAADNGLSPVRRQALPDSKAHGDNMGSIWGQQDPDRPHVGPMHFAIWAYLS